MIWTVAEGRREVRVGGHWVIALPQILTAMVSVTYGISMQVHSKGQLVPVTLNSWIQVPCIDKCTTETLSREVYSSD